jgi:hypothetical protein
VLSIPAFSLRRNLEEDFYEEPRKAGKFFVRSLVEAVLRNVGQVCDLPPEKLRYRKRHRQRSDEETVKYFTGVIAL